MIYKKTMTHTNMVLKYLTTQLFEKGYIAHRHLTNHNTLNMYSIFVSYGKD